MEIRPQSGPQTAFLATSADVAFYGGAAGGGKTWALLIEPLRHMHNGEFGAVIFRRESTQIDNEGGLWDEAQKLYPLLGARGVTSPHYEWRFPAGGRVSFRHLQLERHVHGWQGAQIPLIAFDELTHFTRKQVLYMLSRNRSVCGVRPYVRATYNPVPADDPVGGWIHEFVSWYLDANGEYPDPAKAGVIRWFVNVNDTLHWYENHAEAAAAWPDIPAKSFTFIPSSVFDNKILLAANPEYLANLYALDNVEQERLLRGNHKIKPEAGKVVNRAWFAVVDAVPALAAIVRFWDFAASEKKRQLGAATASVKMALCVDGRLLVLDMTEDWLGPALVDDHAVAIAQQDGRGVLVRWEEEGGSSGKRSSSTLAGKLAGYDCAGIRPTGDKLERLRPLAAQARAGNVLLLRGDWNDHFLSAMHNAPDGLWDVRDAASGAYYELSGPVTEYREVAEAVKVSRW